MSCHGPPVLPFRYAIEALPVSYMPSSQLFCVRATYVLKDGSISVFHESRKGGTEGMPPSKPNMVMHLEDLPYVTKHNETAASKLRLGPSRYDFLYHKCSAEVEAALEENYLSADVLNMLPADARGGSGTSKLVKLLKAILFKPVRPFFFFFPFCWAGCMCMLLALR